MARGTSTLRPRARTLQLDFGSSPMGNRYNAWAFRRIVLAALLTVVPVDHVVAQEVFELNILSTRAEHGIKELSRQTGQSVIYQAAEVKGVTTNELVGRFSLEQALEHILRGTDLSGGLTHGGVITISFENSTHEMREKETMNSKINVFATLISFLMGSGAAHDASAQQTTDEVASASGSPRIEEVIVTARKRSEDLQNTPIAITAMTSSMLADRGVLNAEDLQFHVPNFTFGKNITGGTNIAVRGIGNENIAIAGDAGVAVHLDGHYIQNPSFMTQDFYDVERVEVLRGPQGTLYGKNAIGGSVNIITKQPTEEFEAGLEVQGGNFSSRSVRGYASGSLGDNLQGRIVGVNSKRDGYTKNVTYGSDQDVSDYTAVRGSILFTPTEKLEVYLTGHDYKSDDTVALVIDRYPTEEVLAGFVANPWLSADPYERDPSKVRNDIRAEGSSDSRGYSVDITWELEDMIFRSLSSDIKSSNYRKNDIDGSDQIFSFTSNDYNIDHFSQEFQLMSTNDGGIQWITGLYYYAEDSTGIINVDFFDVFGAPLPDTTLFNIPDTLEATSVGAFAQIGVPVGERLELTFGLRYSGDTKEYSNGFFAPDFGLFGPAVHDKETWSKNTWKLGANYALSDDSMLYATVSTGYKAGGYSFSNIPFDPELVTAYEVGMKSQFSDNKVRLNIAAFYNDYTDKQEENRDPVTAVAIWENAGEAELYGLELEMLASPFEGLQLDTTFSYLHAEYTDFMTSDQLNADIGLQDLSGNTLPRSPKYKIALGMQYRWDLAENGRIAARINYAWQDEQYFRSFNTTRDLQNSYSKSSGSLSWLSSSEVWSVKLFVDNIQDKEVVGNMTQNSPILGGTMNYTYEPPRTYGITISYQI